MDDLSVIGNVIIEPGSEVNVKGLVSIAGGAKLKVGGKLTCANFTQIGDVFVYNTTLAVSGHFTNSGGTNLFLQNSLVNVNDLRILGSVTALQNSETEQGNVYSMVYFTSNSLYLNRAGGSTVCGPVLFTYNKDMGASGVKMNSVKTDVLAAKSNIFTLYSVPDSVNLYQYKDQNCTPQSSATGF